MLPPQDEAAPQDSWARRQTIACTADLFQVNPDVKINSIEVKDGAVNIAWGTTPAHQSTFPLSFLQQASYDPPLLNRDQLLDRVP
jgi:hypothetical protein